MANLYPVILVSLTEHGATPWLNYLLHLHICQICFSVILTTTKKLLMLHHRSRPQPKRWNFVSTLHTFTDYFCNWFIENHHQMVCEEHSSADGIWTTILRKYLFESEAFISAPSEYSEWLGFSCCKSGLKGIF